MKTLENHGDFVEFQGSGSKPYILKNTNGVLSCSCPAWRNQSAPIDKRTCKHLIKLRGAADEAARTGNTSLSSTRVVSAEKKIGDWAMLAESWAVGDKVTGWYRSEKLDGVRLQWDPRLKMFITRAGNPVHPSPKFVEDFPNMHLDGELWMGRGKFQEVSSLARSANAGEDRWDQAFYMVFDVPIHSEKWESRLDMLQRTSNDVGLTAMSGVERLAKKAFILPQTVIQDEAELSVAMDEVIAKGGEGLMLKKPGSLYVPRRSPALLKMKKFHTDDAKVIDVLEGNGRHKGTMGALKVVNRAGAIFAVGSGFTDLQRRDWWNAKPGVDPTNAISVIIEFQYQELDKNSGIPRFPTFKRIRTDLSSL